MIKASQTHISKHLQALIGERHPDSSPLALQSAAHYIATKMSAYGLEVSEQALSEQGVQSFRSGYPNIIGRLINTLQVNDFSEKEVLVVGAHYDTVTGSPGADDNASGLAVLLETARLLSGMQGIFDVQFVAFSLEEGGYIGSEAFLQHAEESRTKIWGAIVLECVGYTDHRPGSQKTIPGLPIKLPDQGDFIGLVGNEAALPIKYYFESVIDEVTPKLPYIGLTVPGRGELLPDSRRSDHVPFWDRDLRAVMLTDTADFRNPNYHQPGDVLEALDLAFMTSLTQTLAETIIRLAGLRS